MDLYKPPTDRGRPRLRRWVLRQLIDGPLPRAELLRRGHHLSTFELKMTVEALTEHGIVVPVRHLVLRLADTPEVAAILKAEKIRRPSVSTTPVPPETRVREWMFAHLARDGALPFYELTRRVSSKDRKTLIAVRDQALADGSLIHDDDGLVRIP